MPAGQQNSRFTFVYLATLFKTSPQDILDITRRLNLPHYAPVPGKSPVQEYFLEGPNVGQIISQIGNFLQQRNTYINNLKKWISDYIFQRGADYQTVEAVYQNFVNKFGKNPTVEYEMKNARVHWQQRQQQPGQGQQKGQQQQQSAPSQQNPLNSFIQYVQQFNISPEQAKNNPKQVFRQLSMQWHPDKCTPENKQKCTEVQSNLNRLWSSISQQFRNATSWLVKAKYS